jgi:CRP-like cAMP-binding protein
MNEDGHKPEAHSDRRMLGDIPEDKRQEIISLAEDRIVPARTLLVRQGEPGDSFYMIHRGRVRVYKTLKNGSELELSFMAPGESFGEMALLTGEPRSANVKTLEETHLTVLSKEQFDDVIHDYPDISLKIVRKLSTWLKKDEKRLEEEVKQRGPSISWLDFAVIAVISLLCGIIFNQTNPNGIKLFPKGLADKASFMMTPETVRQKITDEKVLLLDARPETFFNEEHIKDAVNLPYAKFEIVYLLNEAKIDEADRIVVYGRTISSHYD